MNPHDRLSSVLAESRQEWRAFSYVMQVHENHSVKRAGVAGIRLRARCFSPAGGAKWRWQDAAVPRCRGVSVQDERMVRV
ncbi:hypothetical protein FOT41_21040 [Citrobacter freundii]|nr:hypothetical protein [Citrobacter freundii]